MSSLLNPARLNPARTNKYENTRRRDNDDNDSRVSMKYNDFKLRDDFLGLEKIIWCTP